MEDNSLLLNQMYDLSNEGYKVIDKSFNIISCNKKYAEFNNIENRQEIVGKKCSEYLCSNSCGTEKCSLIEILNDKKAIEKIIEKEINPNEIKYFILNIKPFKNEKNEILGIIECFIDITALKRAEIDLKESEAQLKKVNVAKDKLFSIIAHDLRSPFTSILGFSKILIENVKYFEIKETEEYLGIINSSAENTLVLLDNLLNWAKTQTGKLVLQTENIVLLSTINEIIELENVAANIKNITLNYNQFDEVEFCTDENMVKTILRNLISNAIKFTKLGGAINISTISKHNQVEITVSDNGVGMDDEKRKKLFDTSANITSSGTANEKGSGLGLVLCKEFVEKLGGNIWVESEEGKGSDFKFTLPLNKS
tara:strand:+ start:405 stop:1508 length:1104 start_codon:yes stop_codon:yes gene_type:complete